MAMFNEDKNLKSGGCADEIAALIRDDLSPKMIQEQLENYHNSDIAKSMEQMDRLGRMRLIRSIEPDKLAGIDRKSTRLNSSHVSESRMPSSA